LNPPFALSTLVVVYDIKELKRMESTSSKKTLAVQGEAGKMSSIAY
jgi:hypothetical protein